MTWHPMTTQDVARAHQAELRRAGRAGRLRRLANRLDRRTRCP